ncbi:hypothetical protein Tco_0677180 [Tanacetum coccineum]
MYKVHTRPNQTRTPQLPQDIRKTNKRVSFSIGVIPTTSVSRPQLKSNQLEDRVMPNNSQRKKQEVEDHRKNFKFSNNKTFVTACNDSLNAKTSNVNFVCVTCGKCVLNDNHDMCVLVGNTKSVSHFQVVTSLSSYQSLRMIIKAKGICLSYIQPDAIQQNVTSSINIIHQGLPTNLCLETNYVYAAWNNRNTHGSSGSNTGKTTDCYLCTIGPKGGSYCLSSALMPKRKEEEIAFLADPGLPDIQTSQTVITHNAAYQA